ncbi:hypothetical protein BIW11_03708 [Tropilaelaps mercedesae]|uniref:Uncharacterized protein n=1 Tax=Tropilaelaps mercedesae TaxID=418985 RepID=A0A1V9XHG9_9ACAR|nr:hypothetical protein BIW11_03708 [Tropilaelaps mercedesae]
MLGSTLKRELLILTKTVCPSRPLESHTVAALTKANCL